MHLTVDMACHMSGYKPTTIYNAISRGELASWKYDLYRIIDGRSFAAWLKRRQMPDGFCTVTEACARFGLNDTTVQKAAQSGEIAHLRGPRRVYWLDVDSLNAWAARPTPAKLEVWLGPTRVLGPLDLPGQPTPVDIAIPAGGDGEATVLELRSIPFNPSMEVGSNDTRDLGIVLGEISYTPG